MYRRILVPLDGSERAEAILPYVEDLAKVHGSTIVFLQVIEPGATMVTPYDVGPYFDAELAERWAKEAETYLQQLCEEYKSKDLAQPLRRRDRTGRANHTRGGAARERRRHCDGESRAQRLRAGLLWQCGGWHLAAGGPPAAAGTCLRDN